MANSPSPSSDEKRRRKEQLALILYGANGQTYLNTIRRHVQAFGQQPPDALTDSAVLKGLQERANVSADSIIDTQDDEWDSLEQDDTLTPEQRRSLFDKWHVKQLALIALFESAMTASQATRDFIQYNSLSGTAHVEPTDTAGLDDACDDAVALGEIPIEDIDIALPAHPRCPHFWSYTFNYTSITWMGT